MTSSDNWGKQWPASDIAQLRAVLGLSKVSFAAQVEVHRRTARRWERGDTAATDHRIIAALDTLLCKTVGELAPWLSPIQIRQMHRRDALKLLGTGVAMPLGGVGLIRNGAPVRVGDRTLSHLETLSDRFADLSLIIPSAALIGPAAAHLEDGARLLAEEMLPAQRQRLHRIVGEAAMLVGKLASSAHRPAQANAHFRLAEDHAGEAQDQALRAAALGWQSVVYSTIPAGGRSPSPQAVALLEQADELARRHAPATLQTALAARLAEERAASGDARDADEALDRAQQALQAAETDALPISRSTVDYYAVFSGEGLDGFRGICDILLDRPKHATGTLTSALAHARRPSRLAIILADLGAALADQGDLDAASARLIEGHTISMEQDYPMGLQRIHGVRARLPEACADHPGIRELDERLALT